MTSPLVLAWWATLSAVSVVHLGALVWLWRRCANDARQHDPATAARTRTQFLLCAGYVSVCAFRSFFPRADVQRICLVDSWLSAVAVGRSAATFAELCFVAQWAHLLRDAARRADSRIAGRIASLVVPAIAVAEVFSWYAVLTTNYLGNVVEESIWAATGASLIVALVALLRTGRARPRRVVQSALFASVGYVAFMVGRDVPMYIARFREDESAGRVYLGLAAGLHDTVNRWVPTRSFDDWRDEMPWMSLYFTVAVWLSFAMARAPARWLRAGADGNGEGGAPTP